MIAQEKAKHIELDAKVRFKHLMRNSMERDNILPVPIFLQTRELEKHLWSLIHTAGSAKSAQEAMDKLRKKQTCLEGRVVHALKTYNDALGKNMRK